LNITSQRAQASRVDCGSVRLDSNGNRFNGSSVGNTFDDSSNDRQYQRSVRLDRSRTTGSTGATISGQQKQRPVRHRSSVNDRQVQRPVNRRSTATNRSNDQRATGATPTIGRIDCLRPTAAASDSTGVESAINRATISERQDRAASAVAVIDIDLTAAAFDSSIGSSARLDSMSKVTAAASDSNSV
jgi:hypothetical protein